MIYVSYYEKAGCEKCITRSIEDILHSISGRGYNSLILEKIRIAKSEGREEEVENEMKKFPGFKPSGIFAVCTINGEPLSYNGIVHLEFDVLQVNNIAELFNEACQIPETFCCFQVLNIMNILVRVDSELQDHQEAFGQVVRYYEKRLEIKANLSGSGIDSICRFSYDSFLYKNFESEVFAVNCISSDMKSFARLEKIKAFFGEVMSNQQNFHGCDWGNFERFLESLVFWCNRYGLPQTETSLYNLAKFFYGFYERKE